MSFVYILSALRSRLVILPFTGLSAVPADTFQGSMGGLVRLAYCDVRLPRRQSTLEVNGLREARVRSVKCGVGSGRKDTSGSICVAWRRRHLVALCCDLYNWERIRGPGQRNELRMHRKSSTLAGQISLWSGGHIT